MPKNSEKDKKFGTMLNCMDGRTQLPVINYLKNKYGVMFVDAVNEPGIDKILADEGEENKKMIEWIKYKINISVNHHKSFIIAVVGHSGCAGNPADKKVHLEEIKKSVEIVKKWAPKAEVIGLFVDLDNGGNWEIEEIS